ncbi:MAG: hypothetical protein GXO35_07495, partial [Gammaproteobacteria bacterium]|nr:hypothetical protein [Gammaproteobacteria bacterium]
MADSIPNPSVAEEEPALTKLMPSDSLSSPEVQTWQLNGFRSDKPKTAPAASKPIVDQENSQPELKKQAELLKKEAFDKAHKEGYEAGLAKGIEAGREEARLAALNELRESFASKLVRFDKILSLLSDPYRQLEQQVLLELTDLSLHVAEKVIQQEISQNVSWVLEAVIEAVKVLPDEADVVQVQLHPEDLESLELIESPLAVEWALKSNVQIEPGTCLVSYQNSSVINSWRDRFDEVSG